MSRTYHASGAAPCAVGLFRLVPANNGDWRMIDCAGRLFAVLPFRRAVLRAVRETSRALRIH